MLAPAVTRARPHYRMLPWRTGRHPRRRLRRRLGEPQLLRVPADGDAETLTLPAHRQHHRAGGRPARQLLVAGTPGNLVVLLDADGTALAAAGRCPRAFTWDLAVTRDGRRYAAESTGQLLAAHRMTARPARGLHRRPTASSMRWRLPARRCTWAPCRAARSSAWRKTAR